MISFIAISSQNLDYPHPLPPSLLFKNGLAGGQSVLMTGFDFTVAERVEGGYRRTWTLDDGKHFWKAGV